ncbi:MAG: hypothetical protein ING75_06505 [Rhodocyclaceae bacterium]|nr:hypothetical protein [Rhodocyclaceae bacterium]
MKITKTQLDSIFGYRSVYYVLWIVSILAIVLAVLPGSLAKQVVWPVLVLIVLLTAYCGLAFLLLGNSIQEPARTPYLFLGAIFIFGGAGFDMYATYLHSPSLEREANPVARLLIATKLSIPQILVIGVFAQALFCTTVVLFWRLFLKSYPEIVAQLSSANLTRVVVEIFAGPNRTVAALFVGKVDPKFAVLSIAPILTASFLYRWYLGLEWFQFTSLRREVVLLLIVVFAVALYAAVAKHSKEKLQR